MPDTVGPSAQVIPVAQEAWNPDHLYILLSGKIEELKSALGDLRTADHIALNAAFAAAEKAVNAALAAAEKATDKYERDVERWREANNEWRATLVDREVKFLLIETFLARMTSVDGVIAIIQAAITELRTFRDQSVGLASTVAAQQREINELQEFKNKALGRMAAQTGIGTALAIAISIALRFLGG